MSSDYRDDFSNDLLGALASREAAARSRRVREELKPSRSLVDQECPSCSKPFKLYWMDGDKDNPETLLISSCESGGVYAVKVRCPHCGYEEEIGY